MTATGAAAEVGPQRTCAGTMDGAPGGTGGVLPCAAAGYRVVNGETRFESAMATTLKLALAAMSARRRLLLQSQIERIGGRLSPPWVLVDAPTQADLLLFDPAVGKPETAARALPVVAQAERIPGSATSLSFPPTTTELGAFLERAARTLRVTARVLPAGLQRLVDAMQSLIAGRCEGLMLEADDGMRFGVTAVYGAPRVHSDSNERIASRLSEHGFLQSTRLPKEVPLTGSGSLQQGQFFVWALACELARHGYPLVAADARLKLRRWPLPPEPFIARRDAMRICTRLAPGSADLHALTRSEQIPTADAIALVNAGVILGFVRAEAAPPPDAPPEEERTGSVPRRSGALLQALRAAVGMTARTH